jgi:hypothetical protein
MTMTFVWTGVAFWLALNAAVTVCLLAAAPGDRGRTFDRAPIGGKPWMVWPPADR